MVGIFFFCEKIYLFCFTMPKMGLPFFPFYSYFTPKNKTNRIKDGVICLSIMSNHNRRSRYLVIMSNFKCGEIKENIDLVHNNVVTSLVV